MPDKKKYSLISVEVAPDEEVLHVDASGVHEQTAPQGASAAASADAAQGQGGSASAGGGQPGAYATAPNRQAEAAPAASGDGNTAEEVAGKAVSSRPDSGDSYQATEKDLEGPVPMAGLQKAIIAVVVLCLVGFAVYFGFTH